MSSEIGRSLQENSKSYHESDEPHEKNTKRLKKHRVAKAAF